LLASAVLAGCATTPRTEIVSAIQSDQCVVLLHGVNRSYRAMRPLAEALQKDGFTTVNVDYPSRAGTVDELAPMAVDNGLNECRALGARRIHFVTHSIGGILLRYAHEQMPIAELGRVVMLAPPNQGSEIVDKTRRIPGAGLVGGKALLQLGTDADSLPAQLGPVDFEVGIVAGTGTMNPWMSAMLPNPDDGKVSVARTRVEGMADFLVVDDNHHYIVEDDLVIANTLAFLNTGAFLPRYDAPGPGSIP
ncbi:MAG: alpha/beta fold hydrolase, partial [Woeseiaceae bacterium]|nr:alpha/beta fold hydrolase [Woeseiaceae bacterium]